MTRSKLSTPKHSTVGKRLVGAMREVQALEFARRVREVREGLGLAQSEFAQQFGLSLRSLQEWEQARRLPDTAVLAYLRVIERNPKAVQSALKPTAARCGTPRAVLKARVLKSGVNFPSPGGNVTLSSICRCRYGTRFHGPQRSSGRRPVSLAILLSAAGPTSSLS